MKISRREFSQNCALAATAAALGETMQVENTPTSRSLFAKMKDIFS